MPASVRETATITAANSWTEAVLVPGGTFDLSVRGSYVGVVTLQRRRPGDTDAEWRDVESFESGAEVERTGEFRGAWEVRAGVKSGNWTSGTVKIDLGIA